MPEFLEIGKVGNTFIEGGVVGGGAILQQRFVSRDQIFAKKMANMNPADLAKFQDGMLYKHWGGISAVGLGWASTKVDNPWLKLLLFGGCVAGVIQEARQFMSKSTNPNVQKFNNAVGSITDRYSPGVGDPSHLNDLDRQLKEAAATNVHMSGGEFEIPVGESITDRYSPGVGLQEGVGFGIGIAQGF